jgi:hypothetical protein
MKYVWVLALLVAVGCSSSPEPASQPGQPAQPAMSPKESRINSLRVEIASKRAELAKTDAELAQIAAEREQLGNAPASTEKTDRLVQLGQAETAATQKKTVVNSEIATKQQELQDLIGGPRPKSADDALDSALAEDEKRTAEQAAQKKARDEAARTEEARKVAAAEAAKIAEEEAKKKEMVQGGRVSAAGAGDADGSSFEERWADVLMKVRIELQKYKKW